MTTDVCAIAARLSLPDSAVDDLAIDMGGTDGLYLVDLDLGFPLVREVSEPLTEADGTDDTTEFHGPRVVSVRAIAVPTASATRQQVLDRLGYFLAPSRRPYLYYTLEDGGPERRVRLRAQDRVSPLLSPWMHVSQEVQAVWIGPDGIIEGAELVTEAGSASVLVEAGRTYPLTFDRVYPASSVVGTFTVNNAGNLRVAPIIRLYGPCTDPRIENQTTGEVLEFDGLVLDAGEYIEIDVRASTVELLGLATQSRYNLVDWSVSTLWWLEPGDNLLRYYPAAFASGSEAVILYRPAWV